MGNPPYSSMGKVGWPISDEPQSWPRLGTVLVRFCVGSFRFLVGILIVVFLRKLVDRESGNPRFLGNRRATNFRTNKKGAQPCVPFWVRVGRVLEQRPRSSPDIASRISQHHMTSTDGESMISMSP